MLAMAKDLQRRIMDRTSWTAACNSRCWVYRQISLPLLHFAGWLPVQHKRPCILSILMLDQDSISIPSLIGRYLLCIDVAASL